jgi:hypothetical protein
MSELSELTAAIVRHAEATDRNTEARKRQTEATDRQTAAFDRLANAVEKLAETGRPMRPKERSRINLETMAIAKLTEHGANAKRIAEDIGVPTSTLRNWKNFRHYYNAAKTDGLMRRQRGFNHGNGIVDGVVDDAA